MSETPEFSLPLPSGSQTFVLIPTRYCRSPEISHTSTNKTPAFPQRDPNLTNRPFPGRVEKLDVNVIGRLAEAAGDRCPRDTTRILEAPDESVI